MTHAEARRRGEERAVIRAFYSYADGFRYRLERKNHAARPCPEKFGTLFEPPRTGRRFASSSAEAPEQMQESRA